MDIDIFSNSLRVPPLPSIEEKIKFLNENSEPCENLSTTERFSKYWLFKMPKSGIVIYRNILFFNDVFLNTVGFGILEKFLSNMEIFVYDVYNTENFQQVLTIDDLKSFNENNTYKERRYIVSRNAILINVKFRIFWSYKKTLNMGMVNEQQLI